MLRLYRLEFAKLQWSVVVILIALDALINSGLGAMYMESFKDVFPPSWNQLYLQSQSFHALFFYPLYVGILASLICYYEHQNNAWKQLLTLPISKTHLYFAKFLVLISLMALVEVAFFGMHLITGWIIQPPGKIEWSQLLGHAILGWVSIFPLAALQLWISQKVTGFGKSLTLNVLLVLPNIFATALVSYLAAWYPFAPPSFAMYPEGSPIPSRFHPGPFWMIVAFTFLLYFTVGWRMFVKREWK